MPQIEKEKKTVFYSARIFSLPSLVRIALSIIHFKREKIYVQKIKIRHRQCFNPNCLDKDTVYLTAT